MLLFIYLFIIIIFYIEVPPSSFLHLYPLRLHFSSENGRPPIDMNQHGISSCNESRHCFFVWFVFLVRGALNLDLVIWLHWLASKSQESSCVCIPPMLGSQAPSTVLDFVHGFWLLNSYPQAWTTSPFLMEPSSQPRVEI